MKVCCTRAVGRGLELLERLSPLGCLLKRRCLLKCLGCLLKRLAPLGCMLRRRCLLKCQGLLKRLAPIGCLLKSLASLGCCHCRHHAL